MLKYALIAGCLSVTAFAALVIDAKSPDFALPATHSTPLGVIHATGVVEGATRNILLRPEIVGRVVEVRTATGGRVSAGDVLLRLDDRRERQLVEVSRASLELANAKLERLINGARQSERDEAKALMAVKQAQLDQAIRNWYRVRELHQQAAVPQQQADESETAVKGLTAEVAAAKAHCAQLDSPARTDEVREAQAGVAYAEANLSLAQTALEQCELRSPANGCVLDMHAELGELLRPDAAIPALAMADISRIRVRAFVEEIDAPRLQVGMRAQITADGLPECAIAGIIAAISPGMTPKLLSSEKSDETYDTRIREVLIDVSDHSKLILGLRVDVRLDDESTQQSPPTSPAISPFGINDQTK